MSSSFTRAVAALAGLLFAAAAHSQGSRAPGGYPQKPVRIIVPFSPGTGSDVLGRALNESSGLHVCQGEGW